MTWTNLPATEATDWSALSFINMFKAAIDERLRVIPSPFGALDFYRLNPFELGDDVQLVGSDATNFWNGGLRGMQAAAEFAVFQFGVTPSPIWPSGPFTSLGSMFLPWRNAATNGATWSYWAKAGVPQEGWTRKYPREIDSTADAGSSGQRSRNLSDGLFYDHNGTAWAVSTDQASPADTVSAVGRIEAGDYIGPWIWNELRGVIDLCHTCQRSPSYLRMEERQGSAAGYSDPDDAKAAAEADFATASTTSPAARVSEISVGLYAAGSFGSHPPYDATIRKTQSVFSLLTLHPDIPSLVEYLDHGIEGLEAFERQGAGDFVIEIGNDGDEWVAWRPASVGITVENVQTGTPTDHMPAPVWPDPSDFNPFTSGAEFGFRMMQGSTFITGARVPHALVTYTFDSESGLIGGGLT